MLKIKLIRIGKSKQPFFRIVVTQCRGKMIGRHLAQLGFYDPKTQPLTFKIDKEQYQAWLKKGAKPTAALNLLLKKNESAT